MNKLKEGKFLIGIHDYVTTGVNDSSNYYFRYLLSLEGVLDDELIREVYDDLYLKSPDFQNGMTGPFEDLGGLRRFAQKLCENWKQSMSLVSWSSTTNLWKKPQPGIIFSSIYLNRERLSFPSSNKGRDCFPIYSNE